MIFMFFSERQLPECGMDSQKRLAAERSFERSFMELEFVEVQTDILLRKFLLVLGK